MLTKQSWASLWKCHLWFTQITRLVAQEYGHMERSCNMGIRSTYYFAYPNTVTWNCLLFYAVFLIFLAACFVWYILCEQVLKVRYFKQTSVPTENLWDLFLNTLFTNAGKKRCKSLSTLFSTPSLGPKLCLFSCFAGNRNFTQWSRAVPIYSPKNSPVCTSVTAAKAIWNC